MDDKTLEGQRISDEQLEGAAGGTRDNACLETRTREAVAADDEGEDQTMVPPLLRCPVCGRPYRLCTCYR